MGETRKEAGRSLTRKFARKGTFTLAGTFTDLLIRFSKAGALDAHLSVGQHPRMRDRDRSLVRCDDLGEVTSELMNQYVEEILSKLSPAQRARFEETGEVECAIGVKEVGRFRVVLYRQRGSAAISLEPIPTDAPRLDAQGYMPAALEALKQALDQPRGVILVSGPLHAGKTTAAAAMVEWINRSKAKHIIKIENPIEYLHTHALSLVHQIELGTDAQPSPRLVSSIVRRNPDVIVVDAGPELPILGSSSLIKAAMTRRLVIIVIEATTPVFGYQQLMQSAPKQEHKALHEIMKTVLLGTFFVKPITDHRGFLRVDAEWHSPRETMGI